MIQVMKEQTSVQSVQAMVEIFYITVDFLQDKQKYRKRRANTSADISARLFMVTCNKVSSIYSLYVYYMFSKYSLYFTICSLYVHYIFTGGS